MGLDLEVGILADLIENDEEEYSYFRSELEVVNKLLQQANLPVHTEPENCEVWSSSMFGYSGLHYLRRVAAHLDSTGNLPAPGDDEASADPILEQYFQNVTGEKSTFLSRLMNKQPDFQRGFDHLIVHSDAEGFYVPIDFQAVLYSEGELQVVGGMVGSSPRLLSECKRIAAALEIPSELDETSDALWEAADSQGEGTLKWERYGIESFSCVCLMRGCMKSIEAKAVLVFC